MSASLHWATSGWLDFLQHLKTHSRTTWLLSVIHTPLWQNEHKPLIHTRTHIYTCVRMNTLHFGRFDTHHPSLHFCSPLLPPWVLFPSPWGVWDAEKVLKSCRLFPVNLVPLLYVVVQMFWEEVCWCRRMARHNSSQRAAVGGDWSTPQEVHTCQCAGHRARLLNVTVCLNYFHIFWNHTSLSQNIQNKDTNKTPCLCVCVCFLTPSNILFLPKYSHSFFSIVQNLSHNVPNVFVHASFNIRCYIPQSYTTVNI